MCRSTHTAAVLLSQSTAAYPLTCFPAPCSLPGSVPPTGNSIRLKGRNLTECEHVKLGAYHTLELEPGRSFMLVKGLWDSLDIERIRTATDPQASADLAALLITVGGAIRQAERLIARQSGVALRASGRLACC